MIFSWTKRLLSSPNAMFTSAFSVKAQVLPTRTLLYQNSLCNYGYKPIKPFKIKRTVQPTEYYNFHFMPKPKETTNPKLKVKDKTGVWSYLIRTVLEIIGVFPNISEEML